MRGKMMKQYNFHDIKKNEGASIRYVVDDEIADPDGWYVYEYVVHVSEKIMQNMKAGEIIRLEIEGQIDGFPDYEHEDEISKPYRKEIKGERDG